MTPIEFTSIPNVECSRNSKSAHSQIAASLESDSPSMATTYFTTPSGTRYAVCTAVRYGYRPVSKALMHRVEPLSTEVTQLTITPEQVKQETNATLSTWLLNNNLKMREPT